MRNKLIVIATIFLSIHSHAQISFEKGYYIDDKGEKIEGFLKNMDWTNNPSKIDFKKTRNGNSKGLSIENIKEFVIYNSSKFIKSKVKIDQSSQSLNTIGTNSQPIFEEKVVFLKVLIEGKASLFFHRDNSRALFFFSAPDKKIEQLIFKKYFIKKSKLRENNTFRKQLLETLVCKDFNFTQMLNVNYTKKDLTKIFKDYNTCNGASYTSLESNKNNFFNLSLRPRINSSTSSTPNPVFSSRNLDFDNKLGFGFGIEAELLLPFKKNKWTLFTEFAYQNYKNEKLLKTTMFQEAKSSHP
ncbi:hypothetical protein MTsPCn9_23390 [Croceitalea sp. MTPC9]|uniref:hypothetical protein n=1 Tax=unclassified Croceitalea TaxID=2632280 RepID=UPI002B378E9F|nr:hypothetical protein MTsPCn6_20150 [Croceitalea sp. MTPC6]GMN17401.1 hypothetical protein MTsPCn9_23390 [Croceitalea sp. MTPC9]